MAYVKMDGHNWPLGDPIAEGGFAQVYESVSPEGEPAVLKLVPKDRGAERELLFEELGDTPNVIPILTTGEFESHWVLAMPRAEMSLREHLNHRGRLEPDAAIAILGDITRALAALDGRVVHRDLKPDNVLRWNGAWCLADFGIARYAEKTTASDTRKFAMTPQYAAPEQWRFEQATGATDVYALGVIAYEILCGSLPFPGPRTEDYSQQHLHEPVPRLTDVPANLASAVADCLRKPPVERPKPTDLLGRLERAPSSPAAERLKRVGLELEQRREKEAKIRRAEFQRRRDRYEAAEAALRPIREELREQLQDVPGVVTSRLGLWSFALSEARLTWHPTEDASTTNWEGTRLAFEVIAHSEIELTVPPAGDDYHGRSYSLWYCDAQHPGDFRWYETAFKLNPWVGRAKHEPVMLPPGKDAGFVLTNVMSRWCHASPFRPIDRDRSASFIEGWLTLFTHAVQGWLVRPADIPEQELNASYRTR